MGFQPQDSFLLVTAIKNAVQHGNLSNELMPTERIRIKELFRMFKNSKTYDTYLEQRTVEASDKPIVKSAIKVATKVVTPKAATIETTSAESEKRKYTCGNCEGSGHNTRNCPNQTKKAKKTTAKPVSTDKRKYICGACESPGHNARNCPNKRHCGNCGRAAEHNARTCPLPKRKRTKQAA